jgi:hypothetical protein
MLESKLFICTAAVSGVVVVGYEEVKIGEDQSAFLLISRSNLLGRSPTSGSLNVEVKVTVSPLCSVRLSGLVGTGLVGFVFEV